MTDYDFGSDVVSVKTEEFVGNARREKFAVEFALAYALLHQPAPAPDTREFSTAPCASDLDLHFKSGKHQIAQAIAMCQTCTIQQECLKLAVDSGVKEGVWGGVHFG